MEFEKGVEMPVGSQDDITAAATIASVWASLGHVFLPAEAHTAHAPVSRLDMDSCKVNEFHLTGRVADV
jgi:hypothetical protein